MIETVDAAVGVKMIGDDLRQQEATGSAGEYCRSEPEPKTQSTRVADDFELCKNLYQLGFVVIVAG